jgi:uncharacterized membrane protein (DUF2068 family)
MRVPDLATLVCSLAGHVTPATVVSRLRPGDAGLGVDLGDGRRLCRCLRCDAWLVSAAPTQAESEVLPAHLPQPRRGRELRDAVVLRLIAVERAFHALVAGVTAAALVTLDLHLPAVQGWAGRTAHALGGSTAGTDPTRRLAIRELQRLAGLRPGTLSVLTGAAIALCLLETAEAVGLWRQRRWAEYLTAAVTAALLPLAIDELAARVTVLRLAALTFDVAVLVWLVWAKRLFGLRGRQRRLAPLAIPPSDAPFLLPPQRTRPWERRPGPMRRRR